MLNVLLIFGNQLEFVEIYIFILSEFYFQKYRTILNSFSMKRKVF